jgi:hypothetical protein
MNHSHSTIKTMVVAVALTIPAALSIAAPMSDVVTTREDQNLHQQFGRDSVYAIQTRQPADTESRYGSYGSGGIGEFFAGVGAVGAAAWDKVTGLFEPGSSAAAATEAEPRLYGRAGGYVGTDKLALLDRAGPASETSEPVTTRESIASSELRYPAASEDQLYGAPVVAQSAPSPDVGSVTDEELNAMAEQPVDGDAWKRPDEVGAEEGAVE